jgi:hypothetical protein
MRLRTGLLQQPLLAVTWALLSCAAASWATDVRSIRSCGWLLRHRRRILHAADWREATPAMMQWRVQATTAGVQPS